MVRLASSYPDVFPLCPGRRAGNVHGGELDPAEVGRLDRGRAVE